jgi:hypothetical protein
MKNDMFSELKIDFQTLKILIKFFELEKIYVELENKLKKLAIPVNSAHVL